MKNKSFKKKMVNKSNPIAKLLKQPMLRNKIVQNKKKVYDRKKKYGIE